MSWLEGLQLIVLQVPQSIITEVASEADRKKHSTFALRSFVEENRQLTWCPSPGEHSGLLSEQSYNSVRMHHT